MPLPPLPPRPQVPFRKRSLTALSASLPPLPKVPRVDAQAPRQGRDEEEPVEYDAPMQHPPEGTGLEDQQMLSPTQMMDLLTMERCRVDALHALSEGITFDFVRFYFSRACAPVEEILFRNTQSAYLESMPKTPRRLTSQTES
ncbi:hypothetical protein Q1695_010351 [Nippostrongylus brasiliensis]|nr:hypothetical protein Q1695_010351 [Nippostrongylus brasiliensis]